jgi:hypothetical protein
VEVQGEHVEGFAAPQLLFALSAHDAAVKRKSAARARFILAWSEEIESLAERENG